MENVNFEASGDDIQQALMDLGPLLGVSIKEEVAEEPPAAAVPPAPLTVSPLSSLFWVRSRLSVFSSQPRHWKVGCSGHYFHGLDRFTIIEVTLLFIYCMYTVRNQLFLCI